MKKLIMVSAMALTFSCLMNPAVAQGFLNKIRQKAADKANQKTDEAIDKAADGSGKAGDTKKTTDNTDQNSTAATAPKDAPAAPPTITAYQNYDFRAGDKIIFADNFGTDADGEFPAHWDLVAGQAVVNKVTGTASFLLTDGNYARVKPLMKTDTYMTPNFSIEYDIYMGDDAYGLIVFIHNKENDQVEVSMNSGEISYEHAENQGLTGTFPENIRYDNFKNKWHHIAIAYKNDQMKVYLDQYRILTVPHCNFKDPANIQFAGIGNQQAPIIFTNVKIADGASMNMLDAIMTDGKFVTHGINFDVNKSTLKPESMGVIGDMVKYMQAHPELKLEIDGHTDSDGSDAANLQLSQQRSEAVKTAMVQDGIDASRLSTKGYGASKPLSKNDTPEGKANNRRVEFIKI